MSNTSHNISNAQNELATPNVSKQVNLCKCSSKATISYSISKNQIQIHCELPDSNVNLVNKPRNSLELYSEQTIAVDKKYYGTVEPKPKKQKERSSVVSTLKPLIDLSNGNATLNNNTNIKRRQTISICFVSLIFFFCVIPIKLFQILKFMIDIDNLEITHTIFLISKLLFYTHIMSNPIVYNLMSTKFSRSFKNVLFCKKFKCKFKKSKFTFHFC